MTKLTKKQAITPVNGSSKIMTSVKDMTKGICCTLIQLRFSLPSIIMISLFILQNIQNPSIPFEKLKQSLFQVCEESK